MDFPAEIIKAILCHLDDVKDLKNCLLVSPEIRELIIKTPELMRKLQVYLMTETWETKLPFIERYGFFIRSLKLDDIGFKNTKEYMNILRKTPNLESLIINDCYMIVEREHEHEDHRVVSNDGDDDAENPNNNDNNNEADEVPVAIDENQMDAADVLIDGDEAVAPIENEQEMVEVINNDLNAVNNDIAENEQEMVEVNDNVNEQQQMIVDEQEEEVVVIAENVEIEANNVENAEVINNEDEKKAKDEEIEPLDLEKLTILRLESSTISESIIKSLPNCNKLTSLKLTFYYQDPVMTFTDFMCRQDQLEELDLQGWSEMVWKCLFKEDIREKLKFRLKKFSLECEMSYNVNFSNFIRVQAKYIENLELSSYNINFHYYRMIFHHFHNLTKLIIPIDWVLNDARVNSIKDCRIESLKELELVGANEDVTIFKTIINIFPNIETLKCENLLNFSMRGILENFKKLSCIKSENFRCETMLFVKLPSLKTIETAFLHTMAMDFLWQNLAEDCENIENIWIEDIGQCKLNESIKTEFLTIIKNLKYFKRLKTCKIICMPQENSVNPDHDGIENEQINLIDSPYYKVEIDVRDKTIKISEYFAQHCADVVQLLRENETFKECDIAEG